MKIPSEFELRNRLEALQQARESCEERKIELFRGVNKLKQDLQEGLIDEQRYNAEIAKLPKGPGQIISECNSEIAAIESGIATCKEQLERLNNDKNKDRVRTAAILAALLLFSVGLPLLTIKLTGFVVSEDITAYSQKISVNFTEPQQYVLSISAENVSGELRSLLLSGKLVGEGNAKVYLQKGSIRLLVFDTAALQEKGTKSFITVTGRAVSGITEAAAATAAADKNADKKAEKEEEKAAKEAQKEENKAAEAQPQQPEPVPVAPVEKAINVSLAYNVGTVFDSNDDGVELDTFAIDFTVAGSNFSWAADESKLCTRWVTKPSDSDTATAVCHGSSECCALIELSPHEPSWKDAFYVFVGRDGATYNNTISSQVIFANYSLDPANVYSEIYYSSFATLPATFVTAPKLENATEELPATNVTVIEFNNLCVETCSLSGISGLNLSEYTLVIEVEDATLVLDTAAYTLAKVVEVDAEAPIVSILLPRNITYIETLEAGEERNTTSLSLNFTLSEPAELIWYVLRGKGSVTITANTTITAVNGTNSLVLFARDAAGNVGYDAVQFFVSFAPAALVDVKPPIITLISPLQNSTYNTTAVALKFTVNEPASVSYILNLQNRTEITSNVTLAAEEGRNRLLLLATDTAGNVAHESVVFFVNISNVTTVNVTANVTAAEVNITPLLKSKKPHFKLGEDAELEFEFIEKKELVRVGKWKEGYEGYEDEDDYEEFLETVSAAKKAAVESAVAAEKAKVKRKQLKEWVAVNETIVAQILDSEGREVDISAEIEELREGRFAIKLPKQREFRAGLYKLAISFTKDNATYTQEQNFTWGVLAINVNKSIYLPNEDAFIAMAVLNDRGEMVCDANISLAITDPAGATTVMTTSNGKINVSPECQVYGVTNLPDYYTTYTVKGVGAYVMNLTAATANGIRTILDNFTVQSQVDFDVARAGPTRIYPPVPYTMNITIAANGNYNGPVVEYVPVFFAITQQQGLTVTTVAAANAKALNWNVQLKKGDRVSLSYEFDAPDISPEFYLLGELGIGAWEEARQWQIASDAGRIQDDFFTIVPTSINIDEWVNLSGQYDNTGNANCDQVLSITEGGTTITSSSSTAVQLVDVKFVAPCDSVNLANGQLTCTGWANSNDNIPINWTVKGVTGGGGSKTYTTATVSGCAVTLDATDTLTVNAAADTTAPNVTIIVPLQNSNFSGSFVVNVSVNDSESSVGNVNLSLLQPGSIASGPIAMNISAGTNLSGYWNKTFDSTTLPDGRYNLSVNATDSSATPNTAISANVSIVIDNTKANVTAVVPLNNTVQNGTILINASVNDSLSKVFNVTFRLTTSTGSTLTSWIYATNGTGTIDQGYWNTTFDTTTVADGNYNITINATDFAGNQQVINMSQITINNVPNVLKVDLGIPAEDSITEINQNTTFNVTANVTCNDACGNVNATLRYNISGLEPNENISTQNGTAPFYIPGAGGATVVSYDFNATYWPSALHNASYNASYNRPPSDLFFKDTEFDEGTGATVNNYSNIKVLNDDLYASYFRSIPVGVYATQKFTFRINETETSISKLNITINFTGGDFATGPGTYKTNANVSVWNSSTWESFLNCAAATSSVYFAWCLRNISITQNIANYINESDNNAVYILVQSQLSVAVSTPSYAITDYISLNVIPAGTTNPYSCGSMEAGESCNVTWTVNATLPLGTEWYIDVNFTSDDSSVQSNDTGNAQIKNVTVVAAPDTTAPNVTIIVPPRLDINNTNVSGSFLVNASVNDTTGIARVNLTIYNNTGNATGLIPMSLGAGTTTSGYWNKTFDSTTLRDGYYNLSVNATDSAATPNIGISTNVSIIIDNTGVNVSLVTPANNTNTSATSISIQVTANDSLSGLGTVDAQLRSPTGNTGTRQSLSLASGTIYSGTWSVTYTLPATNDFYNVTIFANDTALNQRIINITTIAVDTVSSNATIIAPVNTSNISSTFLVNASVNDSRSVLNVTFKLYNNTVNATGWFNATRTSGANSEQGYWTVNLDSTLVREGNYNITLNATDTAGNQVIANLSTITIDNTIPNGTILSPANATNIRGFFTINASVNDTLTKVRNVSFRLRSPGVEGTLAFAALATGTIDQGVWNASVNSSTVANGVYNITLNASDFAGNRLLVNTTNILVNNTGILNITLNGPKGGRNITQNSTFTVNATITCSNGYCQQVNATVYYNLTSISPSTRINATAKEIPFHNVTTFVNQTCGLMDIDAVCSLNWTINATGAIGSSYFLSINFTSNNSETAQNGTSNFQINITAPVVTNTAPIVFNSSVALNSSVTLAEGTTKVIAIKFNVTDADGTSDIANAAVGVNISFNGIRRANNSGNCQNLGDSSTTTRLFSCNVTFNYFDNSTTLWDINITAADAAGLVGHNDSQSLGSGAAHNLTVESLSAFSLSTGSVATTANINTQDNELSFVVNNTGNFDFTVLNVTAFNLNASITDIFALEGNFSINATASTSGGFGDAILNATPRNFTVSNNQISATLPHKITSADDTLGNRTLYIYVDVPSNKGLSSGVTYNSSYSWEIFAE